MTNEEAINELVRHKQEMQNDFGWNTTLQSALDKAIDVLKQEPMNDVLNKIKDEIFLLSDVKCNGKSITIYSWSGMQNKLFDIIERYKAERK